MIKDKIFWLLMGTIGAGLLLRIMTLFDLGGFIFDETVSFMISTQPLGGIWEYLKMEMHPVFHSYYLHFWIKFFGNTEEAVRASSTFISLFCFPVLYFLGKEMFRSKKAGLFLVALFSFSSFFIFYSSIARMYIPLFLFTCLSFYFFLRILHKEKPSLSLHLGYIIFTLLAYHTHLTAGVIILVQLIHVLLFNWRYFKFFIWDWIIVVLLYLPWFFFFLSHKFSDLTSQAWFFTPADYSQALLYPFKFIIIDNNGLPLSLFFVLIGVIGVSLFINFYYQKEKVQWRRIFLPLLILIIPSVLLIAGNLTVMRYFIIPCLGALLIASYILSRVNYRCFSGIVIIIILFSLMFNSAVAVKQDLNFTWEEGFRFIEEHEKENDRVILAHDNLLPLWKLYYHGRSSAFSFNSNSHPDKLKQVLQNCNYATDVKRNADNLAEIIENHSRIFLVMHLKNGFEASQFEVKDWFLRRGWQVKRKKEQDGINIFLLISPSEN